MKKPSLSATGGAGLFIGLSAWRVLGIACNPSYRDHVGVAEVNELRKSVGKEGV